MFALSEDGSFPHLVPQAPFSRQRLWTFAASGDGSANANLKLDNIIGRNKS